MFTPMLDPDGCATGKVRFNANGYDVNRHWDEVDLRSKSHLERMPEIWYVKKAILGLVNAGRSHRPCSSTCTTPRRPSISRPRPVMPVSRRRISRLFDLLVTRKHRLILPGRARFTDRPDHSANSLYHHGKSTRRSDGAAHRHEQETGPAAHRGRSARVWQGADHGHGPGRARSRNIDLQENWPLFFRGCVLYILKRGSHPRIQACAFPVISLL